MVPESILLIMSPAHRSPELKKAVCKDLDGQIQKLQKARDLLQGSLDQYEDWPLMFIFVYSLVVYWAI